MQHYACNRKKRLDQNYDEKHGQFYIIIKIYNESVGISNNPNFLFSTILVEFLSLVIQGEPRLII